MKKFRSVLRIVRRLADYIFGEGRLARVCKGWFAILVEYPVHSEPRYGYGRPPHARLVAILNRHRTDYAVELRRIGQFAKALEAIPDLRPESRTAPWWKNPWFSGLDAAALYCFVAHRRPKLIVEIGSGVSTRFARRAIDDQGLDTRMVTIDPAPRFEVAGICGEVIGQRLENTDLTVFDQLQAGDIVFFDGSHLCFTNSDVTVFFLEVMPRVPVGTLIHIHDVHLPFDYPAERKYHYESEQYLLATLLLGESPLYRIVLPNRFVCADDELRSLAGRFGKSFTSEESSFWIEKIQTQRD